MEERLPPYDLEAEEATLGSCLIDDVAIDQLYGWLEPDHFYRDKNRWVFEAILNVVRQGNKPDLTTVGHELLRSGKLEALGGHDYLSNLILGVATSYHVEFYGRIVWRLAGYRDLINQSDRIAQIGYEMPPDLPEAISRAEKQLTEMRIKYPVDTDRVSEHDESMINFQRIQQEISSQMEDGMELVSTPWKEYNEMVRYRPGSCNVIAGLTSMGKTIAAEMISEHGAKKLGKNCLYIYNELTEYQLQCRRAVRHIVLDGGLAPKFYDIEDGKYLDHPAMAKYMKDYYSWPGKITLVNAAGWTVYQICSEIRDKANRGLADFVIIDYLQLIPREHVTKRDVNDARAIGIIMTELKNTCLNLEHQPPLIVLSQVNRGLKSKDDCREDKLRDSGETGAYTNVITFVWNEWDFTEGRCIEDCEYFRGYGAKEGECWRRCLWLITCKNTFGPKGTCRLNHIPTRYMIIDPDARILEDNYGNEPKENEGAG